MNHRWTNQELKEATDLEIIKQCIEDRKSTCTNYYTPLYMRLKAIESKVYDLILSGKSELDREDFFHITSIHRDDIANKFDPVTAGNFDGGDMKDIANHMADDYCEQLFWSSLKDIVSEHLTDNEGNPMELISEGEYTMIYKLQNGNLLLRATNEAKEEYGDRGEKLLEKDIDEVFFDFLLQDHLTYEFDALENGQVGSKEWLAITNEQSDEHRIIYWWQAPKNLNTIQLIFENGLVMQFEQHNEGEIS